MATVQELANEYYGYFGTHTRSEDEVIVVVKDEYRNTTNVMALVYAAHEDGNMLTDDYRMEWIQEALEAFSDYDDPEDAIGELEADVYTSDLYEWLSSRADRQAYVDEATSSMGHSDQGLVGDIMAGQVTEMEEVYRAVLTFLEQEVEDRELAEDDEEEEE